MTNTEPTFEDLKRAFEIAHGRDKRTAAANIIRYVEQDGSAEKQKLRENAAALLTSSNLRRLT